MMARTRPKRLDFWVRAFGIGLVLSGFPAWAQGADFGLDRVTVNRTSVSTMEIVNFTDDQLAGGKIVIEGHTDSPAVEHSWDAGRTWDKAPVEKGRFTLERDPGLSSRDFTVLLRVEGGGGTFAVIVRFRSRHYFELFEDWFKEIREVYIDERLDRFLEYFEEERYDNFVQFEDSMEETFDLNANINFQVQVAEVEVEGDVALVRVDWDRMWDDASRASGINNIVRFRKSEGKWRITDVEDEAMFVIGSGRFRGNISDR